MKKMTIKTLALASMVSFLGFMTSCGGAKEETKTETTEVATPADETPALEEAPVAETTAGLDGKAIFAAKCQVCHQENGEGVPGAFPPLAKSDYLQDKVASIKATISGLQGEVVVNGVTYNSVMAPVPMSDEELLAVMNYIYSSWGNEGSVTMEDIAAAKK